MKAHRPSRRRLQGYALVSVIFFVAIMAMLTASMLQYSAGERRMNERSRLLLRARNMAENAALYASEQLTTKLYRLRSASQMAFIGGTNQIHLPPADVLTSAYSTPADVEVHAGLTESTGLDYIDPTIAANANNPNAGLSVSTSTVPIVAKATMRHPALGEVTAYAQQDLQIAMIPLFQFAVFYNMDMEFSPGPDMTISGPVHTNGNLIARIQTGMTNTLAFRDRVTAAGGFYANTAHKGNTYMGTGSVDTGPGGTGPLNFQNPAGSITNIKSGSNVWRDHKFGTASETATTKNQFKTFATSTYAGNLRTSVHGVTTLELPSIGGYKEVNDPETPEDDTKNGRQIIEAASPADTADLVQAKFSRRSGLYLIVNPDDEPRTGRMPNGADVAMRARSYRAFLNTIGNDGAHTIQEVILPGQPSYGPLNASLNRFPNTFRADTSVGSNQVLRIPQGAGVDPSNTGYAEPAPPAFTDAARYTSDSYFFDLRRGDGSNGYPFNRPANNFIPRPIAKIDFDLTRFKMAVDRSLSASTSSTVYDPSYPDDTTWARSIYNANADAASHGLGLGVAYDNFNRRQITVQSRQRITSNAPAAYAARFLISESSGGAFTDTYWSNSDESSVTHSLAANTTKVQVRQYLAGTGTAAPGSLVDDETIDVIPVDGTSAPQIVLSNPFHIIGTSNTGSSYAAHADHFADAYTDVRVYVGGVDDTANWTFSESGESGGSGSFGTGPLANRFRLTGINNGSTTVYTVNLSASRSGYTSPAAKTFRVEKQSSKALLIASINRTRMFTARLGGDPFQIYFAPGNPNDPLIDSDPDTFKVGAADLVSTSSPSPWFDGVTVYVHSVDAEDKTRVSNVLQRVDSGVRLWHGRGSVISLDGTLYPARTGFSFATNDAAYIVGHFNADGSINSSVNSTGVGGYSGRYAESASEMLCAVMGDGITILSQPLYTKSSSNYYHEDGWADSMSAHRRPGNWVSTWHSSNPSNNNSVDGVDTTRRPASLPNLTATLANTLNVGSGPNTFSTKLPPTVTEVSTCLLTGIVRTTTAQTSGGVHNFPRLLENWNGTGLYIRGSMVAMFESQVATEPWSIRYYQGAGRYWGLHENLRAENGAHDLPLEPIVLNGQRMRYRELTPEKFAEMKTLIQALPH